MGYYAQDNYDTLYYCGGDHRKLWQVIDYERSGFVPEIPRTIGKVKIMQIKERN